MMKNMVLKKRQLKENGGFVIFLPHGLWRIFPPPGRLEVRLLGCEDLFSPADDTTSGETIYEYKWVWYLFLPVPAREILFGQQQNLCSHHCDILSSLKMQPNPSDISWLIFPLRKFQWLYFELAIFQSERKKNLFL